MFVGPFAIVHTLRKLHTFEFHEDLARDSMNADLHSEFQHGLAAPMHLFALTLVFG